ncbi:hypothetical protein [Micromonospora luteifusca]|uniref:hypothetical protein n=1 Tax=Micromonospora luteifusca TaxID=709860 RepID=UPI0033A6DEF1
MPAVNRLIIRPHVIVGTKEAVSCGDLRQRINPGHAVRDLSLAGLRLVPDTLADGVHAPLVGPGSVSGLLWIRCRVRPPIHLP